MKDYAAPTTSEDLTDKEITRFDVIMGAVSLVLFISVTLFVWFNV